MKRSFRIHQKRLTRLLFAALMIVGMGVSENMHAQLTPAGAETKVNTTTANRQSMVATAMDSSGNYVVVWESLDTDGSGYGIFAQVFDTSGSPIGAEIQVNTTTARDQRHPDVGMDQNGNFTVVWMSDAQDANGWGIYRRSFDSFGGAVGGEVQVNDITNGHQRDPAISMLPTGESEVVWRNISLNGRVFTIHSQLIDAMGVNLGPNLRINTMSTIRFAEKPVIALRSDGSAIMVWQELTQEGDIDIKGITYDVNSGSGVIADRPFEIKKAGDQITPDVTVLSDGNYAVVWASNVQDGDGYGIFGQIMDTTGTAVGSEFQVNTVITGNQEFPSIAAASDEGFVVSWADYGQDGDFAGEYAQLFSTAGMKTGSEVQIHTTTNLFQQFGDVCWSRSDRKVVSAWQSGALSLSGTQDGSDYGIYQQRFAAKVALPNSIGPEFSYKPLTISPNPAKSMTRIDWDMRGQEGFLEVFDMQGKLMYTGLVTAESYELDVTTFSVGAYFVRVIDSGEKSVHAGRFVKAE